MVVGMTTQEFNDNVDNVLDMYNENRASLAQVAAAVNVLKAQEAKEISDALASEMTCDTDVHSMKVRPYNWEDHSHEWGEQ